MWVGVLTHLAGDAAGDEDVSVTSGDHVRQDALGQRDRAHYVDINQLAIKLQRSVNHPGSLRPPGIVHQYVDLSSHSSVQFSSVASYTPQTKLN